MQYLFSSIFILKDMKMITNFDTLIILNLKGLEILPVIRLRSY